MIPIDEDAFLPTDNDRIKAQIKELKVRLAVATEKRRKLRRQLIEEDISYVVVSKITEGIKDPTRAQADELQGLQKEIFEQLLSAAETCCIQEILSYHRLGGRTVFDYNKHFFGVRLETFYNKVYQEPYYILFLKSKPQKVNKHTFPKFIHIDKLAERLLPDNTETFFRIAHDNVQAFVARRELMNEIENLSEDYPVRVRFKNASRTVIQLAIRPAQTKPIFVEISFNNHTSSYPTDVVIKDLKDMTVSRDYAQLEADLLDQNIVDVLKNILPEPVIEAKTESTPENEAETQSTPENQTAAENMEDVSVKAEDEFGVEKGDGAESNDDNDMRMDID